MRRLRTRAEVLARSLVVLHDVWRGTDDPERFWRKFLTPRERAVYRAHAKEMLALVDAADAAIEKLRRG